MKNQTDTVGSFPTRRSPHSYFQSFLVMAINILLNQKAYETAAKTVAELAVELALPAQGVAVALDQRIVMRNVWEETSLTEGCSVMIISAVCGG